MGVSIDTGGKGGKKPLDAELNLVPFIDLLVCCICFLLITAVWTQMARIEVNQKQRSSKIENKEEMPPEMQVKIVLLVGEEGYTLQTGEDRDTIPKQGSVYDLPALASKLKVIKSEMPDKKDLTVAVEDGIRYQFVVEAMDVALQQEFTEIRLQDASVAM